MFAVFFSVGVSQALYQLVDGCSREKFPMIDLAPITAETAPSWEEKGALEPADAHHAKADSFLASSIIRKVGLPCFLWSLAASVQKSLLCSKLNICEKNIFFFF